MLNNIVAPVHIKFALSIALVVSVFATSLTNAQNSSAESTEDRMLLCDTIADQTKKLACFNDIVDTLKQPAVEPTADETAEATVEPTDEPTVEATVETTVEPTVIPSVEPPPERSTEVANIRDSVASEVEAEIPDAEPPLAPAKTDPVAVEVAGTVEKPLPDAAGIRQETHADAVSSFGLRRSKSEQEEVKDYAELDSIRATVVRVWSTRGGHFAVELDNGQIWQETERARARKPKVGLQVEITRRMLGSYRMLYGDSNRHSWMRRQK